VRPPARAHSWYNFFERMATREGARRDDQETYKPEARAAGVPRGGLEDLVLCVVGDGCLVTHPLPAGGTVLLGRGSNADIRIDDATISRQHARISNGAVRLIEDLGSANGTRVGSRRIDPGELVEIAVGDTITCGAVSVLVQRPRPAGASADAERAAAPPRGILVDSPQMKELYELAARVAESSISVLIFGETGVGKEVMAESLHRRSPRSDRPFLLLNCGALSDSLLESELFGHEKGAFTGALQTKPGLLESADTGTVFLDEVGEMPAALQVKLLRVIEERRITRVGGLKSRPIDVRFIAATHRDLVAEVARGTFRQDLFFRLNGISLTIPPLRERVDEIEGLAQLFLEQSVARASRKSTPRLSSESLALLREHDWPGNIRELRNLMERAVVLCMGDEITPRHLPRDKMGPRGAGGLLPAQPTPAAAKPPAGQAQAEASPASERPAASSRGAAWDEERRRIVEALERCAGNQTYAARLLGISRSTLALRLQHYGIPRPRGGRSEPKP
jgi:two-component system, NtrC family, response regulator AtoC